MPLICLNARRETTDTIVYSLVRGIAMIPSATKGQLLLPWEWRMFGTSNVEAVVRSIGDLDNIPPIHRDEIHVLQLKSAHDSTISQGSLFIKQLRPVDDHGLELWHPAFKANFPLTSADIQIAFTVWQLPVPSVNRLSYTQEEFVEEIVLPSPALHIAHVNKAERRFTFLGCDAEWAIVCVEGMGLQTFCLRNTNALRILDALRELRLDCHANTSYPSALRQALRLEPIAA